MCNGHLSFVPINLKQTLVQRKICNNTSKSIQQATFFHNVHFISLFPYQNPETGSQVLLVFFLLTIYLPTDHHMNSFDNSSLIGIKGPGVSLLIGCSLFPQITLVIIFSLLFCLSITAQQASVYFKTLSQVSILSSPTRWLHFSTFCFSAFTSSHAALILALLHSHQVKIITSNFFTLLL